MSKDIEISIKLKEDKKYICKKKIQIKKLFIFPMH